MFIRGNMKYKGINVKFVGDKHNNIWEWSKKRELFYKVTPLKENEDKRLLSYEAEALLDKGKLKVLPNREAHVLVNQQWRNHEATWEFNGKTFRVSKDEDCKNIDTPVHDFNRDKFRVGYYKGILVWYWIAHYWPRCFVCPFVDINTEPSFGIRETFWTNLKNIKPIFCVTTNSYI